MTDIQSFVTSTAMERQGGYNRSSQVQAAGLSPAVPMLERAARMVTLLSAPQPIVIADYGSSEGRNSLIPMAAAIHVLRERIGLEREISVVHIDLPGNDYSVLFQTLLAAPDSYLHKGGPTFASAVGRSFYEQVLPSSSVTLGWSSWATQWLSRAPAEIPDHVQVALSHDASAREAFFKQAAEDWRTFLAARERELCPGGRLAILTMAVDDTGEFGYRPLLDAMYSALVSMTETGFLGADEIRRMTIPTVGRSREDFLAPFDAEGKSGRLRVEDMDVFLAEDHIWSEFEHNGDAQAFGARWAAFSRASVYPTLAASLDGDGDHVRSAAFIERLETETALRLASKPERMVIPLCKILLLKEA